MRIIFFLIQPLDQFDIFILNISYYSSKLGLLFIIDSELDENKLLELLSYIILKVNFTNLLFYLLIIFLKLYFNINLIELNKIRLITKSLWQYLYENYLYKFILSIVLAQIGKIGQFYTIYISSLFIFILFSNFIGLIPNSFTITSHIILTFMFGFSIISGLTILGLHNQGYDFFDLFIPKNVPNKLLPLLVAIEVTSYIARSFSLSIRLFANLMSGHSLIHILLFFIIKILKFSYLLGLLSLFLITIIFCLEIGISFLQAYVFVVLVSIYFKDAYGISH